MIDTEPGAAKLDFSIVIPAHNEAGYIRRALESIRATNWPLERLEVIVVDNASSDATAQVVRAYAGEVPQLALALLPEPLPGAAHAKNSGAARARGDILLFLDADSRVAPDLLTVIAGALRAGEPAGCIPVIADGGDWLDRSFFRLMEFGKRLFDLRAQMFYCERALFGAGFDAALQLAEDQDFLTRLRDQGVRVGYLRGSWIATSPRRLHSHPLRLGLVVMFGRWLLAHFGLGRRWRY
ncbi:MAG TPA: glycosyltransferase [Thermomicrobiaceae bacterium]|nr:glycosyltransferase [Thermomicrobiaceae bacterium]